MTEGRMMSDMVYRRSEPDRTPLSEVERRHYEVARETVREGLKTFQAVGSALMAIRDNRWYREDYATFEQFLMEEYGRGRQWGYQLIKSVKICEDLKPPSGEPTMYAVAYKEPESEHQVRPLKSLAPDERKTAWGMVCQETGDRAPTIEEVEDAARRVRGAPDRPRAPERVAINPADLRATAYEIIKALDHDHDAVNNLILHIRTAWAVLRIRRDAGEH
jgi:hypothetical protein